jgi:p-aminobenzoyl-glutamate transporter AbgT
MRFSRVQIIGALVLLGLIWLVAIIRLLIFSGS